MIAQRLARRAQQATLSIMPLRWILMVVCVVSMTTASMTVAQEMDGLELDDMPIALTPAQTAMNDGSFYASIPPGALARVPLSAVNRQVDAAASADLSDANLAIPDSLMQAPPPLATAAAIAKASDAMVRNPMSFFVSV
jgi:hypothetical protein